MRSGGPLSAQAGGGGNRPFNDVLVALRASEFTDQTRHTFLRDSGAALDDNTPHDVVIARINDVVTIVIDGQSAGSKTMDQKMGSLPTLRIDRDVCAGAVNISGPITHVCVRPN